MSRAAQDAATRRTGCTFGKGAFGGPALGKPATAFAERRGKWPRRRRAALMWCLAATSCVLAACGTVAGTSTGAGTGTGVPTLTAGETAATAAADTAEPAASAGPEAGAPAPGPGDTTATSPLPGDAGSSTRIPTAVSVSALDLSAPVVPVGVAPDGQVEVPPDGGTVGWYRFGPPPGAPAGSAVLVGHVDTADGRIGEFAGLERAAPGLRVSVQRGTAPPLVYRVVRVETVPKGALPGPAIFRRDGPHQLVLVTCAGAYDRSAGGYQANLVVTSVPENA
ncbi:class F sortase [Streptodolium elevatio]|uniref:Class F sortase n=1 Tax=Streptodolium elevatio TaxID=3157996 RepID=A0ABV3DIH8_9ACTN